MGSERVVKELVEHGAEVNGTNAVRIYACLLLVFPVMIIKLTCVLKEGLTALMIATSRGKVEVVDALLRSKNINVDKSDEVYT